jgi:hypothetical protein
MEAGVAVASVSPQIDLGVTTGQRVAHSSQQTLGHAIGHRRS